MGGLEPYLHLQIEAKLPTHPARHTRAVGAVGGQGGRETTQLLLLPAQQVGPGPQHDFGRLLHGLVDGEGPLGR